MVSAKYSGERWEEARKAALARDRVCQDCGTDEDLHVHHIRPVRTFEDYQDAHGLSNLVVLCSTCHPKWEGRRERPNTLDEDGRVQLSQLVHTLSRETVGRLYEPPGPWILTQYFKEKKLNHRRHCEMCFRAMGTTRAAAEYCPECGRPPRYWDGKGAYSLERITDRVEYACSALKKDGVPVDVRAGSKVARRLWEKDEYHSNGWLGDRLLMTAVHASIKSAYNPDAVEKEYGPICPSPKPVEL